MIRTINNHTTIPNRALQEEETLQN